MAPGWKSFSNAGSASSLINPKQLDRFRDRYFPAGAKDAGETRSYWPIPYAPISIASAPFISVIPPSFMCVN
jgi:hypothetical protein